MIEKQRKPRPTWASSMGTDTIAIAGDIDMTTVSRDGITVSKIHGYPDPIGQRVAF